MKRIALATLFFTSIYTVPAFSSSAVTSAPQTAMDAPNGTPECSQFSQSNRALHQEHRALKKEYGARMRSIREHYKEKGCPAEGHAKILPIENRALTDKIAALDALMRENNISLLSAVENRALSGKAASKRARKNSIATGE